MSMDQYELYHEYGLFLKSRTIVMKVGSEQDIDHEVYSNTLKNLTILEEIDHEPIRIYINSPGGNVTDGMAIYDAIKSSPCYVTGIVLGEASSMGSVILQACDKRMALPFSCLLLHDGQVAFDWKNVRDVERNVEAMKNERLQMYKIFAERTGKEAAYWSRKLQYDYILSAKQALEEHLIDEIIEKR